MRLIFSILISLVFLVGTSHAQTFKIMSYNIHIGQNAGNEDQLLKIADFIKSTQADVVGLQEVDSVCNRSGKVDQMKFLAEHTGMYYAYARHFAFDGGSYGIGILSKTPLTEVKDHRIILTSDGKSDAATRALLSARVSKDGSEILFSTVHMDYRDANSRFAQSQDLLATFGNIQLPVILTGDFNAEPGTRELVNLERIFTDTGKDTDFSFSAIKPVKKIDFVMVSKAHLDRVKKTKVPSVLFSDHLPVVSKVKIRSVRN